jgi:hypothetical protein
MMYAENGVAKGRHYGTKTDRKQRKRETEKRGTEEIEIDNGTCS